MEQTSNCNYLLKQFILKMWLLIFIVRLKIIA